MEEEGDEVRGGEGAEVVAFLCEREGGGVSMRRFSLSCYKREKMRPWRRRI